jgi:hypothetical protein
MYRARTVVPRTIDSRKPDPSIRAALFVFGKTGTLLADRVSVIAPWSAPRLLGATTAFVHAPAAPAVAPPAKVQASEIVTGAAPDKEITLFPT